MRPTPEANPTQCPSCGSVEHYARVPLLYEASSGTTSGYGRSSGLVGGTFGIGLAGGTTSYSGIQESHLARRLRPPSPPTKRLPRGLLAVTLLLISGILPFLLAGVAIIAYALLVGSVDIPPAVVGYTTAGTFTLGVILLPPAWIWGFVVRHRRYRRALAAYHEAYERWAGSWFCLRCGHTNEIGPPLEQRPQLAPEPLSALPQPSTVISGNGV